ncbi:hypothetical protein ABIA35_006010 [Catenulispora sp. MAP12-49]|uniref:hypothetical protein n=1 Tax=Catenulispora sp. MAP12-49 TaxID=3156302 RepID=UPI003516A0F7
MATPRSGERYSEVTRAHTPELSGRVNEVAAARAQHLAEDPFTTAEDIRQFRAEYAAERARRKAAAAQLDRDLLALMETSKKLSRQNRRQ